MKQELEWQVTTTLKNGKVHIHRSPHFTRMKNSVSAVWEKHKVEKTEATFRFGWGENSGIYRSKEQALNFITHNYIDYMLLVEQEHWSKPITKPYGT